MIELPSALPSGLCRILVTGWAGFIGGVVVRWLLRDKDAHVFNLDKCGYSSDCTSIEAELARLCSAEAERHQLIKLHLAASQSTVEAARRADPDLVLHLAAKSHVRSLD